MDCCSRVVKVKSETLKTCMTCPLCNKVIKEATTISLCLHTFCRKCIYKRFTDEEEDCCPVCNIDLGAIPVEKLRPDHNLEDLRAKVFPYKRRKVEASEVVTPEPVQLKRKERPLSSLVLSASKVSMQTGRRSKGASRKAAFYRSSLSAKEQSKEDEISSGDHSLSSNLKYFVKDSVVNKRQVKDASSAKPFDNQRHDEDTENNADVTVAKADLWTPLNCLVEAANRSKSSRGTSQGLFLANLEQSYDVHNRETKAKADPVKATEGIMSMSKNKIKEHVQKTIFQSESNGVGLLSGPVKRRRLSAANRKSETVSEELGARFLLSKENRRNTAVWLRLVASENQKDVSLPQISKCYLRLKDGNVPVSCIQKYLAKKLDLTSEAEVEIMCRGERVIPTLRLQNLLDLWFKTSSTTKRVPASAGTSAKDFVMVLFYSKKVHAI